LSTVALQHIMNDILQSLGLQDWTLQIYDI
jgi:hypothetical protein